LANDEDKRLLLKLYAPKNDIPNKVERVTNLFNKYKMPHFLQKEIEFYTQKSLDNLKNLSLNDGAKKVLKDFSRDLMCRTI